MRAMSAADTALFSAVGGRATFARVDVQDGGGTWRDMTSYLGTNMVLAVDWSDSVDGEGQNGTITFKREQELLNLSPLMQGSPANLAFAYPGSFSPLVFVGRGARIYSADVPWGQTPQPSDWRFMFDGKIDKVDPGSGEEVKVSISDLQGPLRDTFIEAERVYAFATGAAAVQGCRVWSPLATFAHNELVIPTEASRNGHFYVATTAGSVSTSGTEPIWPTAGGGTVVDGGETWQEVGATAAMTVWSKSLSVALGDRIMPTAASANGHFYKATAGVPGTTSATTEPTWPTGSGATVTDNGITWTEAGAVATAVETIMGQLCTDNGQSVTVNLPGGSPGWLVKVYLQQRQALWDALRALADQIGWDLRYQYDAGSGTFKLNLWTPNRSKVIPDYTFAASQKLDYQALEIDVSKVRNAVEVVFCAGGTLDPSGNPVRVSVVVTDSTSISKYGRRYMLMAEASTSNIDTTTEATAMANAALSDLKEPTAEVKVPIPYFPFVELGDLYRFSPDATYSDQNLDLAVVGYEHTINADGEAATLLTLRGHPSTGCDRWLSKDTRAAFDDVHQLGGGVESDQPKPAASSVVGGTLLQVGAAATKRAFGQDVEWHIGTANNFTPSQQTLLQSQGGNQATAPHLLPGKAYYGRYVPIRRNDSRIFRGQPSPVIPFTAGQASAGHLTDQIALGDYPLNAGFETQLDQSATGLPDHWSTNGIGTPGTDYVPLFDANGMSGGRYMEILGNGSTQPLMLSAVIPLINESAENNRYGGLYRLRAWIKPDAGNGAGGTITIGVGFVDYTGNSGAGFLATTTKTLASNSHVGHWQQVDLIFEISAAMGGAGSSNAARNAYVFFNTSLNAGMKYYVDEIRLQYLGTPWYAVGDTTKFCDNYESIPPFTGTWANFGGSYTPARFRKDALGKVYLDGLVNAGVIGTSIFTLPVGYRPDSTHWKYFDSGGYQFDIRDTGQVTPQGGVNTHVWLGGISFYPGAF
jgi:hypothetical protein